METSGLLVGLNAVLVLVLMGAGVPIYAALGVAGVLGIMALRGLGYGLVQLGVFPYPHTASYLLTVVPLFIIMGHFAFHAGISGRAYDIGRKWLGRFPGGLAMATIVGCAFFAATCGSSVATAATMGRIAIPEMEAQGYDRKLACGCVAAGGTLGIMIPPSVVLVFYGALTETSIGAMLIAGVIPGIVSSIVFILGLAFLTWKNPALAPPVGSVPWRERFASLKGAWGMVLLFVIVIGGIYAGVFTPTEAGAVGAFVAFLMMVARRTQASKLGSRIVECFTETLRTNTMIFLILVGAGLYGIFLTLAQVPQAVSQWAGALPVPPLTIVIVFLFIYLILGCFLDAFSMLVITLPMMFPIIVKQLGYNPIWFGILVTKMVEIGLITPPVGLNVYTIAGVAPHVPMADIFRGISWFFFFELVTTTILVAFPVLSTWLPGMMYTWAR